MVDEGVTSLRDTTAAGDGPPSVESPASDAATVAVPDVLGDSIARHPTALGRHLDVYLAAVVRELQARGVITGSPQRTDPSQRLIGSIVVDCTALRAGSRLGNQLLDDPEALGAQPRGHAELPAPVIVTWDEITGWCAGLHHDQTRSSRRYLHPDLLPAGAVVAEFVVSLAEGRSVGAVQPLSATETGRPTLRLVQ
jgi:hypothetical protein